MPTGGVCSGFDEIPARERHQTKYAGQAAPRLTLDTPA